MISSLNAAVRAFRRWREDRAMIFALERLDERSRRDLEHLVRLCRDKSEFHSKGRSVRSRRLGHIAIEAGNDHA
jgi:hypothetical protein